MVPSRAAAACLVLTAALQGVGLALSVAALVLCLNVPAMYQRESAIDVNITVYIQAVAGVLAAAYAVAFALAAACALLGYRALVYLTNGIDRRTAKRGHHNGDDFAPELARAMARKFAP